MIRALVQACGEAALHARPAATVSAEHTGRIADGAERFLDALAGAEQREWTASSVPLLAALGRGTTPLGSRFRELAPSLPWSGARQDPSGTGRAIASINDLFDLGPVTAGLLCSLPGAGYPEHQHPPQELYVVLDGAATWRFGGSDSYVDVRPGQTLYNEPLDLHGLHNPDEVVVALFVLWGDPDRR